MDKVIWCAGKKEGLTLVEPNQNLASAYIKKAEEALESMRLIVIRDWKISTAYYAIYFSLYSLLMRIGIKCEIHSCTIEFARRFLGNHFSEEEIGFIEDSLKARIDSQYYIDRTVPDRQFDKMIELSPKFLVKCKSLMQKLSEKEINEIRKSSRITSVEPMELSSTTICSSSVVRRSLPMLCRVSLTARNFC